MASDRPVQLALDCGRALPEDYGPRRPERLQIERIVLAAGSDETRQRLDFISGIASLYPDAEVEEHLDLPHNRIELTKP